MMAMRYAQIKCKILHNIYSKLTTNIWSENVYFQLTKLLADFGTDKKGATTSVNPPSRLQSMQIASK